MSTVKRYDDSATRNMVKGILNETLKDLMSILKAECGSIFFFDGKTKELVLDSYYNANNLTLEGITHKVGEGISGKVVDSKTPVLVKDINRDDRFIRNGFNHYQTNSFISIPLFDSQGLLGVMNIADKSSKEPFSEKDMEFAVALSRYACVIVDNLLHSEKLKQEKEFADKQKHILEKYASVGKLAAGVVHEVNNPLDGIIRYTNMLLHHMEQNTIGKEYLLEIKKGLNRIANITRSLLEFSHQVSPEANRSNKYKDVHHLIEECLEMFKAKMDEGVLIERKYHNAIPKMLDIGLSHVFINIIKNAIDAMPEGGVLEISTGMRDSIVEIRFKDSGLGIPNDIKERIFETFFSTKSIDRGTGLGLSICKEIVSKYEGQIEVESMQGEGSIFSILIPKKFLENA